MNTIILNGSPKGNSSKSNTRIITEHFVSGMKEPCEIKCIAKADPEELAAYIQEFDTVIICMPLYIHAMPGIVMKFIEYMKPARSEGQSLGFIIQAGFIETAQHDYVRAYIDKLAAELNYNYLGTVSKGEAAGIYMFPKMFRKVLRLFVALGIEYEKVHSFDRKITTKLEKPYKLSKFQVRLFNLVTATGLNDIGWHRELRKNKALDRRLDKPFLNEV